MASAGSIGGGRNRGLLCVSGSAAGPRRTAGSDRLQRGFSLQLEHHVYILAMVGLTVFFAVEVASRESRRRNRDSGGLGITENGTFWFSMISFAVLNASIGYAVASPEDQAVEPLWLFALAMGLHFLANDCSLVEHHGERYQRIGRWLLIGGLIAGWLVVAAAGFKIPPEALGSGAGIYRGRHDPEYSPQRAPGHRPPGRCRGVYPRGDGLCRPGAGSVQYIELAAPFALSSGPLFETTLAVLKDPSTKPSLFRARDCCSGKWQAKTLETRHLRSRKH